MKMGEMDNELELGCKPLNLDNWSIEFNEDVVEKVAQEAALYNWMKGGLIWLKIVRKIRCRISK